MKVLIKVLFFVALLTLLTFGYGSAWFGTNATAQTYQQWEYAAIQPSKLGTVEAVDASFFKFQGEYAAAHGGCWDACYEAVVTEWLHANGCATCSIANLQMSFKLKVDAPNYQPVPVVTGTPQPWMYTFAATYDSGLMSVDRVQASFYATQVAYANAHGGCWDACYEAVATEWLHAHACASCFIQDNQLSFKLKSDRNIPQ